MYRSIFAVLAALLIVANAAAQSEAVNWQKDYAAALSLSRETGKPLLLDFTAKWCAPCQAMERDFWTRADVAEAMQRFVAVKVDYDSQKPLVNRYAVRGLPYVAFSDSIGNLLDYRNSFGQNGAETLKQISKDLPADFTPLNAAYKAFELKRNDGSALLEIADFYAKFNLTAVSEGFYKRALPTREIQSDAVKKECVVNWLGAYYFSVKNDKQAAEYAEEYLKSFPAGANRENFLSILTISNVRLGNLTAAEASLQKFKAEFPKSSALSEAVKALEEAKIKRIE